MRVTTCGDQMSSDVSLESVMMQKVSDVSPESVNIQDTFGMYLEDDDSQEVPGIHLGDDVIQEILQKEDTKNIQVRGYEIEEVLSKEILMIWSASG